MKANFKLLILVLVTITTMSTQNMVLGQCPAVNTTYIKTVCDSYTWIDGITYTSSIDTVTYTIAGGTVNGCDSIITLDLTINYSSVSTDILTACDSYTWMDGITYTTSNDMATYTIPGGAANGCDSIVNLDLTINYSSAITDILTACGSYTWIDGITYTTSNDTATYTIPGGAVSGCDSIITLDLTINSATIGTDIQTACDSLTWIDGNTYTANNNTATHTITGGNANGCDSTVTLDLTINSPTTSTSVQTACNSFTWIDGITYTTNNSTATYTIVGGAANGCDSTVSLFLTINQVSDLTTTVNGPTVSVLNPYATYQWLDCDAGMSVIPGATFNTYTTPLTGNFAVELTENGCVDTTACVPVILFGVEEHSFNENIKVSPNPSSGVVTLQFEDKQQEVRVKLWSITGQLIETMSFQQTNLVKLTIGYSSGIYFAEVLNDTGEKAVIRLIKE